MFRNTKLVIGAGITFVVLMGLLVWWLTSTGKRSADNPSTVVTQETGSKTKLPVPGGTVVPDLNSQVPADVAKPESITAAAPTTSDKFRTFELQVNGDKFIPENVIINTGDYLKITFTAVDKNYDFIQPDNGYKGTIAKGQTAILAGQFPAEGKYIFYCETCGGPDKGPVGYITVVKK